MHKRQQNRKYYHNQEHGHSHNHGCERQEERINALERDNKKLMQTVFYGNGQPSMLQQVQELADWFKSMKDDIKKMQTIFYKLVWLFVGSIIAAILQFFLRK